MRLKGVVMANSKLVVVDVLCNTVRTNQGDKLPLTWANGMVGVMPVFNSVAEAQAAFPNCDYIICNGTECDLLTQRKGVKVELDKD